MLASLAIHFAVMVSGACVDCPTVEELNLVFPDTSNQQVSGKIVDGIREPAQMRNHYEWYRYEDRNIIWQDPPGDVLTRAKLIVIENQIQPYKLGKNSTLMVNNTSILGDKRWVSDGCNKSIIPKDNWMIYLGDTIRYMLHNCDPKYTTINTLLEVKTEKTNQDITTSYKWKLDKWLEETKEKCRTICKEY